MYKERTVNSLPNVNRKASTIYRKLTFLKIQPARVGYDETSCHHEVTSRKDFKFNCTNYYLGSHTYRGREQGGIK